MPQKILTIQLLKREDADAQISIISIIRRQKRTISRG